MHPRHHRCCQPQEQLLMEGQEEEEHVVKVHCKLLHELSAQDLAQKLAMELIPAGQISLFPHPTSSSLFVVNGDHSRGGGPEEGLQKVPVALAQTCLHRLPGECLQREKQGSLAWQGLHHPPGKCLQGGISHLVWGWLYCPS
jgi:hypothetical protein